VHSRAGFKGKGGDVSINETSAKRWKRWGVVRVGVKEEEGVRQRDVSEIEKKGVLVFRSDAREILK
jgi:hypothetical protein